MAIFEFARTPGRRAVLLGLAGSPLLLSACAETSDDASSGGSDGSSGGGITVGTTDKVTSLDPAGSYDNGSSMLANQCFGYLMSVKVGSTDGAPEPDLAEKAEFTSDTEYTVTLRDGLKFSNGNPLTSASVKFSFDRQVGINDPNGPASLLANLDSVEAPDEKTVVFKLKEGNDQTFPYVLTTPVGPIMDEQSLSTDALTTDDDIVKADAFSGPYKISSYSFNELVSFETNPNYQGQFDAPATDSASIKYYADANNMKLDIQQGNIDAAYRSLSATDIEDLSKNDDVKVNEGPGGEIRYIVFNFDTMPYGAKSDEPDEAKARAVRQAMADLIDRQSIATDVYKDTYTPLFGYVPDGLTGAGEDFKTKYGDGDGGPDAAKAKSRLDDAGVTTPVKVSLQYNPDHYGESSGDEYAAIKDQLETDGLFSIDLQSTEWVQYSEDRTADVYPVYQLGWFPDFSDADNYLTPFFTEDNFLQNHYSNPEVVDLITQEVTQPDAATREQLIGEVQDKVSDDVSTLPLLQGNQVVPGGADVQGVTLDSSYRFRLFLLSK